MRAIATILVVLVVAAGCSSGATRSAPGAEQSTVGPDSADTAKRPDPVDAAVAYVASTDDLIAHSPVGRAEIFRKLVVPTAVAEQARGFEEAAAALADTLDTPVERLTWVEAALTAVLVNDGGTSAAVDVWAVSVLGAPDAGAPQQVWRTVHVNLELTDGRWLVSNATADTGPTPSSNELALPSGWDEFAVVAGWPAVVEGVGL